MGNDIQSLAERIRAELDSAKAKIKQFQTEALEEFHGRQARHALYLEQVKIVSELAKPRLEKLAELIEFKASPVTTPDGRTIDMSFKTDLAHVKLTLRVTHDSEVRNLLLEYELEILPIFFQYTPKSSLSIPIDAYDAVKVSDWIDDRLVEFTRNYLRLHFTDQYQRDQMVVDPVSKIQFPKQFAKSSLQRGGQTYYFMSDETRQTFEQLSPGK